jgi:hypothetical protein
MLPPSFVNNHRTACASVAVCADSQGGLSFVMRPFASYRSKTAAGSDLRDRTCRFECTEDSFFARNYFVICTAGAAVIGALLRLYLISDQLLWDDEWHGINVAFSQTLGYIVTHFHADDNCIPLSIYFKLMLDSIGLDEILIRLPSIAAGLLVLVSFGFIARRILHEKPAIVFVCMIATSPLLVYYSRVARPYGIVVLLGFVGVSAFYLWMTEGIPSFAAV